ncbi:MAG TPA: hypothetical protein VHS76_02415 [Steroidobacteraceae bacterium]|jgi:hypothetical protein|nr:hypothetical protein [Steroidobacteraceae bacterium]
MATPADLRLLELLARWLESLELHTKYSSLDDDSYWNVQPWSEHQRPTRWIIDLARQKTLALRAQVEQRAKTGDTQFSDALELMAFLANLVGAEHIERFIPVAEARNERDLSSKAAERISDSTIQQPTATITATREMPKFLGNKRAPPPAGTAQVARNERKPAAVVKPAPKAPAKLPPKKQTAQPDRGGSSEAARSTEAAREQVIADAARLVQWGRKWFELPELIARMADRPSLPDVRRILKENKAAIDKKAGNP